MRETGRFGLYLGDSWIVGIDVAVMNFCSSLLWQFIKICIVSLVCTSQV